MKIEDLKKKYPVTHGKDHGPRITIGELVSRVGKALDAKGASPESVRAIACDILDRDFLFGAWGESWRSYDYDLLADIRGAIINAYRAGQESQKKG